MAKPMTPVQKAVTDLTTAVGEVFKLQAWPGQEFSVDLQASYQDGCTGKVWLVLNTRKPGTPWLNFCREEPADIRRQAYRRTPPEVL